MHPKIATGRIGIYARYSSDLQNESSIDDQARRAREAIARAGGDPARATVFPDYAVSGGSMERPGLEALLRAVEAGRIDVILTEDVSRISRDMGDAALIFKRLQFASVPLIGLSDGIDTSARQGKLTYAFKSMMAEWYIDELRDRTLRGLEGRALAGFATGNVPFGYRTEPEVDGSGRALGNRILIDEDAAPIIRRIFTEYRDGGALHQLLPRAEPRRRPIAARRLEAQALRHGARRRSARSSTTRSTPARGASRSASGSRSRVRTSAARAPAPRTR